MQAVTQKLEAAAAEKQQVMDDEAPSPHRSSRNGNQPCPVQIAVAESAVAQLEEELREADELLAKEREEKAAKLIRCCRAAQ